MESFRSNLLRRIKIGSTSRQSVDGLFVESFASSRSDLDKAATDPLKRLTMPTEGIEAVHSFC